MTEGEQHISHSPSKRRRANAMYPFNYLLEAIDFTSRQSSPERVCGSVASEVEVKDEPEVRNIIQGFAQSLWYRFASACLAN